jgi:hypothetical protein
MNLSTRSKTIIVIQYRLHTCIHTSRHGSDQALMREASAYAIYDGEASPISIHMRERASPWRRGEKDKQIILVIKTQRGSLSV